MEVLTAILHKGEGMYVAECPEVDTVSQRRMGMNGQEPVMVWETGSPSDTEE